MSFRVCPPPNNAALNAPNFEPAAFQQRTLQSSAPALSATPLPRLTTCCVRRSLPVTVIDNAMRLQYNVHDLQRRTSPTPIRAPSPSHPFRRAPPRPRAPAPPCPAPPVSPPHAVSTHRLPARANGSCWTTNAYVLCSIAVGRATAALTMGRVRRANMRSPPRQARTSC